MTTLQDFLKQAPWFPTVTTAHLQPGGAATHLKLDTLSDDTSLATNGYLSSMLPPADRSWSSVAGVAPVYTVSSPRPGVRSVRVVKGDEAKFSPNVPWVYFVQGTPPPNATPVYVVGQD